MGHGGGVLQSVEPSASTEPLQQAAGAVDAFGCCLGSCLQTTLGAAALPGLLASASSHVCISNYSISVCASDP